MKKAIGIEETTEFEEKREIEKILAIVHSNYRDIHNHNELEKTVHISAAECSRLLRKYDALTTEEKNRLWKLVLRKVTAYRTPDGKLSVHIYPKLPKAI